MMTWLYMATGFTGAWTLHFLVQQIYRLIFTEPSVNVSITNGPGSLDLLLASLKKARREVQVLARTLHSPPVAQALVAAKARKVNVEILVDPACEREGVSDLGTLIDQGMLPQTIAPDAISMGAVIIIDSREVFCGGYCSGPEVGSDSTVDLLHFRGHPEVVTSYQQHFKNEKIHARQSVIKTSAVSPAPVGTGFKGYTTPGTTRPASSLPSTADISRPTVGSTSAPTASRSIPQTRADSGIVEKQPSLVGVGVENEFTSLKSSSIPNTPSTPRSLDRTTETTSDVKPTQPISGLTARSISNTSKLSDASSRSTPSASRSYTASNPESRIDRPGEEESSEETGRPLSPVEKTAQAAAALARLQNQTSASPPKPTSHSSHGQRSIAKAGSSGKALFQATPAPEIPDSIQMDINPAPEALTVRKPASPNPATMQPPPASADTSNAVTNDASNTSTPSGAAKPADNSNLTPLQRKLAALGINIGDNSNGV